MPSRGVSRLARAKIVNSETDTREVHKGHYFKHKSYARLIEWISNVIILKIEENRKISCVSILHASKRSSYNFLCDNLIYLALEA